MSTVKRFGDGAQDEQCVSENLHNTLSTKTFVRKYESREKSPCGSCTSRKSGEDQSKKKKKEIKQTYKTELSLNSSLYRFEVQ